MRKQNVDIVSGVVTEIETIDRFLSFVTLNPLEVGITDVKIPFYSKLSGDLVGRHVDFKTTEKGLFFKTIKQEISSSNLAQAVKLTKSQAEAIINNYKSNQYKQNTNN